MLNQKMNARPGIAGLDFIAVIIGSVIGAVIGALAMMAIQIVRIAISGAAKIGMSERLTPTKSSGKQNAESVARDPVEMTDKVKPDLQKHKAVFAPALEKQYQDSFCRQVKVKGGHVNVWFYPNLGIARRSLVITQAGLIKKLGRRIALPEVKVDLPKGLPDVIKTTSEEAFAILSATKLSVPKTLSEKAVLPESDAVVVTENEPKEATPLPTAVSTPAHPRKKEAVYQGVLMKYGIELRDDGKDPYQCFCLHLHDKSLGAPHQLWGTDLQRAIKEAGVRSGDEIEITQVGSTPTAGGRKKKVFAIQKLASRRI